MIKIIKIVTYSLLGVSLTTILPKIIGLELLALLQTAYFSVIVHHHNIDLYIGQFVYFKETNGYNVRIFEQGLINVSQQAQYLLNKQLLIYGLLINNYNVMFLACFGFIIILYLFNKILTYKSLKSRMILTSNIYNISTKNNINKLEKEIKKDP